MNIFSSFGRRIVSLLLLSHVATATMLANDYLEVQSHYSVYSVGPEAIHVKVPLWAYGRVNNYYIANGSYLYFKYKGSQDKWFAVYFKADQKGENDVNNGKGSGEVFITPGRGNIIITNTYDGVRQQVNESEGWKKFVVKQGAVDDCSQLTTLEFDWYPPESLTGKDFILGMYLEINKYSNGSLAYKRDFEFPTIFTGGNNLQAPQLYSPYLYVINEDGNAGYGLAAMPYVTFQTPINYTTSLDPMREIKTSSRSGSIYVNTADTVQSNVTAEFTVFRDESLGTKTRITSSPTNIPAYHRIYDLEAKEEKDESGSLTGANTISWTVRHSSAQDLMESDYFEVQRAYKSDYSDAKTLEVVAMRRGTDEYSYRDNSRSEWKDRHVVNDTLPVTYYVTDEDYTLTDADGNNIFRMKLKLTAPNVIMPAQPVYYRVRRASSAAWGWDHEFAKTAQVYRHNYLAPLAKEQQDYTCDKDFNENHKVHFNLKIDNADVPYQPVSIEDCELEYEFTQSCSDTAVMNIHVADTLINSVKEIYFETYKGGYIEDQRQRLKAGDNEVTVKEGDSFCFYIVPREGTMFEGYSYAYRYKFVNLSSGNFDKWNGYTINLGISYCDVYNSGEKDYRSEFWKEKGEASNINQAKARWEEVQADVKQQLYERLFGTQVSHTIGKCLWDRTAKLILTRHHVETGEDIEIIVPQDSIRRQSDGSWLAHITDVAASPCTHYIYNVRIDQSDADLRVSDSTQLAPIVIKGPELYFNEAARIQQFTATQGATEGTLVNSVLLNWQSTSSAVDNYVLCRLEKGSDQVPDTLTVTTDNTFTDETALPGVHYEYTITARYACNGISSANSASAEGWRTTFGRIAGHVTFADNSGQKGITVTLTKDGTPVLQTTTDTSGEFVFENVEYDLKNGTSFIITPTAQYGQFSYNNSSSGAATVVLSAENALVTSLDFVNTLAYRLTGRALYKHSTIPVADALFVLNGDTICRGGQPVRTATDGSFELLVPRQPVTLQIAKQNHTFEGDGILEVDGSTTFTPTKPIDGIRFYDQTKVRLVGRVAGGTEQQKLKHGFGLGRNNLGDDLQLVLMLEGDNTAHIVHDPNDLTCDTVMQTIILNGTTNTLFEQKRIIIHPDPTTGEYAADLFPVKYKVVQATAKGYATLFPSNTGSETFDLTNAPLTLIHDTLESNIISYNAIYDRIYRSPVQVAMTQMQYGMACDGLGEKTLEMSSMAGKGEDIPAYTVQADGSVDYLLGYPVFIMGRKYQFQVSAFEDYRYNNTAAGHLDRVPQRGGNVTVRNGMESATHSQTYALDNEGKNKNVFLEIKDLDYANSGTQALRTVTTVLEAYGSYLETDAFRAFVSGNKLEAGDLHATDADIVLLDIVRDPGGMNSSAWLETGTTYKYAYKESYHWELGAEFDLQYGMNVTQDIGITTLPGTYIGSTYNTSKQLSFKYPAVHEWKWGYTYSYEFTTTDRISTSSSYSNVGRNADVFLGTTTSMLSGKVKSVALISDSLWQARQPAYNAGTLKLLAKGFAADGKPYYLVTGQKVTMGTRINNTFVYTQTYVLNTLIPNLAKERQDKLETFANEEAAQAAADARDEVVYWDLAADASTNLRDTLKAGSYKMIVPRQTNKLFTNEVAALDNIILKWITILYHNEKEKVAARISGQKVGTWSVSGGTSIAHSDSYNAAAGYNEMPQGGALWLYELGQTAPVDFAQNFLSHWKDILQFWKERGKDTLGKSVAELVSQYNKDGEQEQKSPVELGTFTNVSKWDIEITPVFSFEADDNRSKEKAVSRKTGFTISPDPHGDMTISVYRARFDDVWENTTEAIRDEVEAPNDDLYGSYVFFTEEGTTYCPHEGEERTLFYNKGTLLNNDTRYASKPEMTIDTYEQTNVPADKAAIFRLTLMNNGQEESGKAADGEMMTLSLVGGNPDGAVVTIDGQNLAAGYPVYIKTGEPMVKTLQVVRGTADDYNDLELMLSLNDCPKVYSIIKLSVHYLPVSCDVAITQPRDKWIMNTLSAKDSIGYYLPISIDGFDINHKNFDHIEFQYKLTTENSDAWVNQCSFFASDSLYALATGNKAMIENGRIAPFRFYGHSDPKELSYDLRAVSFCRHGSGFVSKSSAVLSGTKDTRPPILFGKPQPADGILTLSDDIRLRFSEAIAGNWLDEDNNFQLQGVTNQTGITSSSSLYFAGTEEQSARSEALRGLAITDLTVDMMIRPAETDKEMTLFAHGDDLYSVEFMLTGDKRLKTVLKAEGSQPIIKLSKPMPALATDDFTRVIMVYDFDNNTLRFYAGTSDISEDTGVSSWMLQNEACPIIVGKSLDGSNPFHGNITEVRIWTKSLRPEEIAETHMRRLTGYEYGLIDYYPMNEGSGTELADLASGATLTGKGLSWVNPQGISLALSGEQAELLPTNFSRAAAQDYTLMFWFQMAESANDSIALFTTYMSDSITMQIGYDSERLFFSQDNIHVSSPATLQAGEWHHLTLSVSKTYNTANLYLDGNLIQTFASDRLSGLSGSRIALGGGLKGYIDDLCLFEQALPLSLVKEFDKATPSGDEMGLIALLTFSETRRNQNNIPELVFSINDQRHFKDANGKTVNKEVPLLVGKQDEYMSDKRNYAPVCDRGNLSNLNFTWTSHDEELLINLNMQDREINKRTLYLTVRDVEDLAGNRLPSPVTWTVYADLNSIRWLERRHTEVISDNTRDYKFEMGIFNSTGRTRQYTITGLPEWLTVTPAQGTLDAEEESVVTFTIKKGLAPKEYNAVVFLTDDQGLAESLCIDVNMQSECPWNEIDAGRFERSMALRAQVFTLKDGIEVIDTDEQDVVGITMDGEIVGLGSINYDEYTRGYVYITVFGNRSSEDKKLTAWLWQHDTGRTLMLSSGDIPLRFTDGETLGCPPSEPVRLTATDGMMQTIHLDKGWTWASFPFIPESNGIINDILFSDTQFAGNDEIKSPATNSFCRYNGTTSLWNGSLSRINNKHVFMFHTANEHTLYVYGKAFATEEDRTVSLKHGWNVLPYLRTESQNLRDALASYYSYATEGDIVKSHDEFAVFSAAGKWEGNLTFMQPGSGYMLYRGADTNASLTYTPSPGDALYTANHKPANKTSFNNPEAASNMTMIAKIASLWQNEDMEDGAGLSAYIGDELVGFARPQVVNGDTLLLLNIQNDKPGKLRFEYEGLPTETEDGTELTYQADSHHGTIANPVVFILSQNADGKVKKRLIDGRIYIFHGEHIYNVQGAAVAEPKKRNSHK